VWSRGRAEAWDFFLALEGGGGERLGGGEEGAERGAGVAVVESVAGRGGGGGRGGRESALARLKSEARSMLALDRFLMGDREEEAGW
jgi:hypothetical protein